MAAIMNIIKTKLSVNNLMLGFVWEEVLISNSVGILYKQFTNH